MYGGEKMKRDKNIEHIPNKASGREDFRVPEGYFEQLPGRVMEEIRSGEKDRVTESKPALLRINPVFAMAAAVIAFAVIGYFFVQYLHTSDTPAVMSDHIVSYSSLPDDINEDVLYEYIEKENISAGFSVIDEDSGTIIDYLMDEGVDESLLAQQL